MSDTDRRPPHLDVTPVVPPATAGNKGSFPLIVGALLLAVLAIGYFAIGVPGIRAPNEARAPEGQVDGTTPQQAAQPVRIVPAPSAPPAMPRP